MKRLIFLLVLALVSSVNADGLIYGRLTAERDNGPLVGAGISTNFGQKTQTDADGFFRLNVFADSLFSVTFSAFGFNDSVRVEQVIAEGDSVEFFIGLLNPQCEISIQDFSCVLQPEDTVSVSTPFTLSNNGNGFLCWKRDYNYLQRQESIPIGTILKSARIRGVVFAEGKWIIAGENYETNNPALIYVSDPDSLLGNVATFKQFGNSRLGMEDLAYDGDLIWGVDVDTVYGFTIQGEVKKSFKRPMDVRGLAWDNTHNQLLMCGRALGGHIKGYDRDGNLLNDYGVVNFEATSLAYWSDDPDGYQLYLFHQGLTQARDMVSVVHKMNMETKDTMFVAVLRSLDGMLPEGCFITNQYDILSWVFIAVLDDWRNKLGDVIDVIQLGSANRMSLDHVFNERLVPTSGGVIWPGEVPVWDMMLNINPATLTIGKFRGEVVFQILPAFPTGPDDPILNFDAVNPIMVISVKVEVLGPPPPLPPAKFNLLLPEDGATMNTNDSTKMVFSWEKATDPNKEDTVKYRFRLRQGERLGKTIELDSTSLIIDFANFSWEDYGLLSPSDSITIYKWWVDALSGADRVMCNETRNFSYVLNRQSVVSKNSPISFGLNSIHPNPFNSVTTIRYATDRTERLSVRVYNLAGQLVTTLVDTPTIIGNHEVTWNSNGLSSGIYIIRLEASERVQTTKIALIK